MPASAGSETTAVFTITGRTTRKKARENTGALYGLPPPAAMLPNVPANTMKKKSSAVM